MVDSGCREFVSRLWKTFGRVGDRCAGLTGGTPDDGILPFAGDRDAFVNSK